MALPGLQLVRNIPRSLGIDSGHSSQNHRQFKTWMKHVQQVFSAHTPPILISDYIGSGGFSRVFRAASDYEGITDFAIKILRPELLEPRKTIPNGKHREEMRIKDVKKRFTNESYVQWALSQNLSERVAQSVVKVYDHGEFDSRARYRFILMERMESTLRTFMQSPEFPQNSPEMLLRKTQLMSRIATLIFNVHLEGIIHRDIKPENIFFTGKNAVYDTPARTPEERLQVKLGDFGTVRWIKTYTDKHDGIIIGSQWYLSPEQIYDPENLDTRTDIYSFGVVCYELMFGVHPKVINVETQTSEVLHELARTKPAWREPPSGYEPLARIIFRCMADLDERYQSMGEVAADLRAFSESLHR